MRPSMAPVANHAILSQTERQFVYIIFINIKSSQKSPLRQWQGHIQHLTHCHLCAEICECLGSS